MEISGPIEQTKKATTSGGRRTTMISQHIEISIVDSSKFDGSSNY